MFCGCCVRGCYPIAAADYPRGEFCRRAQCAEFRSARCDRLRATFSGVSLGVGDSPAAGDGGPLYPGPLRTRLHPAPLGAASGRTWRDEREKAGGGRSGPETRDDPPPFVGDGGGVSPARSRGLADQRKARTARPSSTARSGDCDCSCGSQRSSVRWQPLTGGPQTCTPSADGSRSVSQGGRGATSPVDKLAFSWKLQGRVRQLRAGAGRRETCWSRLRDPTQ